VRADPEGLRGGKDVSVRFENARTYASGLRVPKAYADYLILKILRVSKGEAVTVTDEEMRRGVLEMASSEGSTPRPRGARPGSPSRSSSRRESSTAGERVVVFDTGTGYKYVV